jgi:hypothetical protein
VANEKMTTHQGALDILARIHAEQQARGYIPRSAEEIDESIREMRDEWEDHQRAIEKMQEEFQKMRAGPHSSPAW